LLRLSTSNTGNPQLLLPLYMDSFDLQIIREWRELGYYYEFNEGLKQWRFYGSKTGLQNIINQLNAYGNNPANNFISEHIHLGPYNYLKIMTWHKADIAKEWIAGTISDLNDLKNLITQKLSTSEIGDVFIIGKNYASDTVNTLLFIIMADNFDPASIEFS